MLGLWDLVKTEAQLVYLTAIMQPRDKLEFLRLIGLLVKGECY